LAQRLVRILCSTCKEEDVLAEDLGMCDCGVCAECMELKDSCDCGDCDICAKNEEFDPLDGMGAEDLYDDVEADDLI